MNTLTIIALTAVAVPVLMFMAARSAWNSAEWVPAENGVEWVPGEGLRLPSKTYHPDGTVSIP